MGEGFTFIAHYDSSFENFSGKARAFYSHTWQKAAITGIGFSAGADSFGLDVEFSNSNQGFTCYSNADTNF